MTEATQSTREQARWHTLATDEASTQLTVDPGEGLSADEVQQRLAQYGPNELAVEEPPSVWSVASAQLLNPMNIMLVIVGMASLLIDQVATAVVVLALVAFNVVMGSNQS